MTGKTKLQIIGGDGERPLGRQRGQMRRAGAAAFFLLASAVILAAAYTAFSHYAAGLRAQAEDDLVAIAQVKATQISDYLREREGDAEILVRRPAIGALLGGPGGGDAGTLRTILPAVVEQTRSSYGYRRVAVFDAGLAPAFPSDTPPVPPLVAEGLRTALRSGGRAIIDLHPDTSGAPVFGVARAVPAGAAQDGRVLGVAYLEIPAETHLYPLMQTWPSAPTRTGETLLLRAQDGGVLYLSPRRHAPGAAPPAGHADDANLLARRAVAEPPGVIRGAVNGRGRPVLGATVPIEGTPWTLLATMDADEAEAGVDELRDAITSLSAIFLALAAAISLLLWRGRESEIAAEQAELNRRLQRLNRFYAYLTRLNHALAELREPDAILRAVCEEAAQSVGFLLVWGGTVDEASRTVRVVSAAGAEAGYAEGLELSIDSAQPAGRGPTGTALREGRTEVSNDFRNDLRTAPWHERARAHGIGASAVTPVMMGGRAVATITFYAAEPGYFDAEMIALLEEAARSVTLAWEAGAAERERDAEQARRAAAEARYQAIFESSPLPKQIVSIRDGRTLGINRAHERLFGYKLPEIEAAQDWFDKLYATPEERARLQATWERDVRRAATSLVPVASPELRMRCRDGQQRIVRGHMAILGEEAIIAWTDLTELRRQDEALRESERRFRSMVEQAVSGFYVVRDNKLVYVNPRMAALSGYTQEEMIGMDPIDLVVPEDRAKIEEGRRRHYAGEQVVGFQVRARRKDGSVAVTRANGAIGTWDGKPAIIVLVEDVTERALAEEKIRGYVARLERSMRSTLEAVAKMVEMRDPYTAGHERRVGEIAAAIARELGWDEQRCHTMELVGLVHDIGKIAVPAEILSKPTRLTPPEFEIVKSHAQAGYEIIKDVQFDDLPVAEIIREHHERMDGSGYPQGLPGERILPEARVLAVADVLESMASHRPYRPALGLEAALAELQKNRGRLYCADCVDAVLRLVREKGFQLPA
jgi:PAS domain S-box-containing protein